MNTGKEPAVTVEYTDPQEGFKGWLVIDTLDHTICAGGMRVQKGLSLEHLVKMASNMTCKMRICGLRVDGAKSGIDYDPTSPGKHAAMARFMRSIEPYIRERYSMGPDLNVDMNELESAGKNMGLPSVKYAVANAQGWDIDYFIERYSILRKQVDGWPLGQIRAGYGVAAATLAVFEYLGIPNQKASAVIQGFGTLARAAAYGLARKGVRIMAIADHKKSIIAKKNLGLDIPNLLNTKGSLLPDIENDENAEKGARDDIFSIPCDVLIPAAIENAITAKVVPQLQVKAVVPGANLAVTSEADQLLFAKDIIVLPDLLAGSGGSLSMEGLFAPETHPEPQEVLDHVEQRMTVLVKQILKRSKSDQCTPYSAALKTCAEIVPEPGTRPYGAHQ